MTILINCGGTEVDFNSLPESSQKYLAQKACNHLFANVLDSKVAARVAKAKKDENRDLTDEEKSSLKAEFTKDTLERLVAGTMEVRAVAPRKSDEERWADEIALDMVKAIAKEKKVALPKEKEKLSAMVARILDVKAADIAKQVEARRKAKAKMAESADTVLDDLFA